MKIRPRSLVLLWLTVLAGPIAWALSLTGMFWLSREACVQSSMHGVLTTGIACVVVTVAGGIRAAFALAQPLGQIEVSRFMLIMAVSTSALFALVIALSMVPISLLTPCPL